MQAKGHASIDTLFTNAFQPPVLKPSFTLCLSLPWGSFYQLGSQTCREPHENGISSQWRLIHFLILSEMTKLD
jgi:hypothetical protein